MPAVSIGHEDPAEARGVEHRGDAHEAGADLDTVAGGIDGISLHARCAGLTGSLHDAGQQRGRHPHGVGSRGGCGSTRWTKRGGRR